MQSKARNVNQPRTGIIRCDANALRRKIYFFLLHTPGGPGQPPTTQRDGVRLEGDRRSCCDSRGGALRSRRPSPLRGSRSGVGVSRPGCVGGGAAAAPGWAVCHTPSQGTVEIRVCNRGQHNSCDTERVWWAVGQWCVPGQGLSGWRACVGYKPRAVTLNESSLMNGKKEHDFLPISLPSLF
jgi:hypothetical protein